MRPYIGVIVALFSFAWVLRSVNWMAMGPALVLCSAVAIGAFFVTCAICTLVMIPFRRRRAWWRHG